MASVDLQRLRHMLLTTGAGGGHGGQAAELEQVATGHVGLGHDELPFPLSGFRPRPSRIAAQRLLPQVRRGSLAPSAAAPSLHHAL